MKMAKKNNRIQVRITIGLLVFWAYIYGKTISELYYLFLQKTSSKELTQKKRFLTGLKPAQSNKTRFIEF